MPPKPKNTRDEVLEATIQIIRSEGVDALTARSLGKCLNTAASTVFTHFNSMEELKLEAARKIKNIYDEYVGEGLKLYPPFKQYAIKKIHFASEEPNFFALLFFKKKALKDIDEIITYEGHLNALLELISQTFEISSEQASRLYSHMWIYAHGIATVTATGVCSFTDDEISNMLGTACKSFLETVKKQQ